METPNTINTWASETFGRRTAIEILVRCNIELAELLSAVHVGADLPTIKDELADVNIMLSQAFDELGVVQRGVLETQYFHDTILSAVYRCNAHMALLMAQVNAVPDSLLGRQLLEDTHQDLLAVCKILEVDLQEVTDLKMQINRARVWKKTESGRFQHA